MGPYVSLCVPMGLYGSLMGRYETLVGQLCVTMCSSGSLWLPMCSYGSL